MSRALWFVAGAGAGAYALTKARRAAEALTPDGLADRLAGLSLGAHLFGEEVRAGMAEREQEIRGRLAPLLAAGAAPPQLTGPTAVPDPTDPAPNTPPNPAPERA
jgi:hypothetical protein